MSDLSKIRVDDVDYDLKDATARGLIGDVTALGTDVQSDLVTAINELVTKIASLSGITYVESSTDNMVNVRDLDSGTYVFQGKFRAFSGATSVLSFSSKLLVNIVKGSSYSSMMVLYPVNNCVQYLKITDTATELKKYIYLNDLADAVDTLETSVGDITTLTTTNKTSLVDAINELAAKAVPAYTEDDYGKFLTPSADGLVWYSMPNAEEASF